MESPGPNNRKQGIEIESIRNVSVSTSGVFSGDVFGIIWASITGMT